MCLLQANDATTSPVDTVRFVKGGRYVAVLTPQMRVYECLGLRGKKTRRVGFYDFGELEYNPKMRIDRTDNGYWYSVRLDGQVETCDRGMLRADRLATDGQAAEYANGVKKHNDDERAYWAEQKAKRERDAKRLAELERLVKEKGLEA